MPRNASTYSDVWLAGWARHCPLVVAKSVWHRIRTVHFVRLSRTWKVRCASAAAVSLAHEAIKKQMQGRQTAVASSRIYFTVLKLEWKKEATQSQVLHYLKDHLHRESHRHPNPASANSQCALAKWNRVNSERAEIALC